MKVLHICETIKGGVGTYLNTFDQVFSQELECRYLVPEQHADHLNVQGDVQTFDRPTRGLVSVYNLFKAARRAALKDPPDMIFFESTYALLIMALFRLFRVPGVYFYIPHGWARLRYNHKPMVQKLVSVTEGRLSRLADCTINVSENDRQIALSHGYGGQHVVVENVMPDLAARDDLFGEDETHLLFVGRFDRQKGLDILLAAYQEAAKHHPELHLHIIGAAVEDGEVGTLSDQPESVTFHGWVAPEEIGAYYASADLVVMPSRWESLPLVIIEALRAGTPVMLSDACGMGALIEEGKSGYCVPLDIPNWTQALTGLDHAQLRNMRQAARKLYETRYNQARFQKEMYSLMQSHS
jgi:glycosyltransferase involved in cell wall biosynthesis